MAVSEVPAGADDPRTAGRSPARAARELRPARGVREGREDRAATRRRIVEVALELIADHGFAATSTREISERLGFTKAALYYHFRTKDDLLAAVAAPALDDLARLVDAGEPNGDPAVRRRLVAGYLQLVATHRDLIRVLSSDPSIHQSEALAAALPLYAQLTRLLAGTGDPDAAQRTRVRAALGAVHAALLRAPEGDEPAVVAAAALEAACGALGVADEAGAG